MPNYTRMQEAFNRYRDNPSLHMDGMEKEAFKIFGNLHEALKADPNDPRWDEVCQDNAALSAPPPPQGNVAALREALEKIVRIAEEWDTPGIHAVRATLYRILEAARAALASPARNCDRFATAKDAENAFVKFCARASSGKAPNWRCPRTCGHINPSDWATCCIKWLLAPAEGGEE